MRPPLQFFLPASSGQEGSSHPGQAFISIRLDMQAFESLQLGVDGHSVKWSILSHPRIKLKEEHVRAVAVDKVGVWAKASHTP